MSVLALYPRHDSPGHKDATGAFAPEAQRFAELHGGRAVAIDNRLPVGRRRDAVVAALRESPALGCVALFCHGTTRSTQLLGKVGDVPVDALAKALADGEPAAPSIVALYCCSTAGTPRGAPGADGEGSFADGLRDALCREGQVHSRVYAHDTVGHTTQNPHVRVFDGAGSAVGGTGGYLLVAPGAPRWRAWKRRLREAGSTLRLRFPLMAPAEVVAEVSG